MMISISSLRLFLIIFKISTKLSIVFFELSESSSRVEYLKPGDTTFKHPSSFFTIIFVLID